MCIAGDMTAPEGGGGGDAGELLSSRDGFGVDRFDRLLCGGGGEGCAGC